MPYDAPGKRVNVVWHGGADGKTPIHTNSFAVVGNRVGLITKVIQPDRFVRPTSAEISEIQPNEEAILFQGGVHELALAGALGLGGVSRDDKLWINTLTSAILTAAGGGTGGAPANEKQSAKVQGTAGSFKLAWTSPDGTVAETANIKFNATAVEVQAALEALANINVGDVTVTGGPGNEAGSTPYVIVFGGRFADTDVNAITATDTLTGGEEKVTVTTVTAGAGSSDIALPLGVVDEIDATRTPHIARVDLNAWQCFIPS
jgi:hypothetical protein